MRVLISGAGIAGPTLAWFLSRAGAHITIIEKTREILPHGQNVDLQGSAVTVVKKMGLLDEIRRRNTKETGTQFIDPNEMPFAPFPVTDGSSASPTSEYEILRGDLAAIFHESTKDHPRINYLFDTTISEVLSNDEGSVKVRLSDGGIQEFDLLVAADGQWSKLRKQVFASDSVKVVHFGMYAAYFTIPRISSDNNLWNVYIALGSKIITLRPDPYGNVRAMFSIMPCSATQEKAWLEASRSDRRTQENILRKEFADVGWQAKRLLDAMSTSSDFYFHPMQQIRMANWSNGRVVCLGDAAYAPSPLAGMGTSLAIIGAYILAGELSVLTDGENPGKALALYESKLRPLVESSQKIPWFIPGIAHPETAWKRWLVHTSIRGLSKFVAMPWVKQNLPDDASRNGGSSLPHYAVFGDGSS